MGQAGECFRTKLRKDGKHHNKYKYKLIIHFNQYSNCLHINNHYLQRGRDHMEVWADRIWKDKALESFTTLYVALLNLSDFLHALIPKCRSNKNIHDDLMTV